MIYGYLDDPDGVGDGGFFAFGGAIVKRMMMKAIDKAARVAQAQVQINLSGLLLKVGAGHLRRSFTVKTKWEDDSAVAVLGSKLIYARIHEYGGEIRPVNAKHLRFPIMGSMVKTSKSGRTRKFKYVEQWVTTDLVVMPAKHYIEQAIDYTQERVWDVYERSFREYLAEAQREMR